MMLPKLVLFAKARTSDNNIYKRLYRVNDFNVMILSKLVLLVKTITRDKKINKNLNRVNMVLM